jgi:zinc protease
MSRHHNIFAAVAVVALAASVACVSTQRVDQGARPDPRAALPPVPTKAEKAAAAAAAAARAETVLLVNEASPIVDVRVVFRAGSADDPAGKEGLTALMARLMREATVDKDQNALAEALFPMAAELDVQVDKDALVFMGRVHKDHLRDFAQILADVILRPRLDEADFKRLRDDALSAVSSTLRTGNDELLQREALEALLYDAPGVLGAPASTSTSLLRHPYRHTPRGTVQGLQAITLDDVRAQRARVLTRDRAVVGIGGGVPAGFVDAFVAAINTLPASTSASTSTSTSTAQTVTTPKTTGRKILIIEKPSAGSAISLGFTLPELSRSHPDYPALKLAETWFGEHRNLIGHLFNTMREARGLNYGDYAYVEHFVQDGWSTLEQLNIPRRSQYFSMWIRPVEHKNRLFALRMAEWELARFVDEGIPNDATFTAVQSFVMGFWKSKEQDPMRRLGYAVDEKLTGMPFDRDGLRARVQKLTRADVNAAIKRHLQKEHLAVVVVTEDAAALKRDAVGDVPSPPSYTGQKPQAVLDEDKAIVGFDLGVDDADVVIVPPTALFER